MILIQQRHFTDVLAQLVELAQKHEALAELGLAHMHGTPLGHLRMADSAVKTFEGLPDEHPLKRRFNPDYVRKGYDLFRTGQVNIISRSYY